ncbi:oligomeric Golgi complex subunit 3 [Acrasis kona]|uniref:Conserved oligomeric Golgi complex subunit 3 n=1 Tax=Acrasis kona TaxID=1008807 RepID=A0AAW2YT58_9EUKA
MSNNQQQINTVASILREWDEGTTHTEAESSILEQIRSFSEDDLSTNSENTIIPEEQVHKIPVKPILNRLSNPVQDKQMAELSQFQKTSGSLLTLVTSTINILNLLQQQYKQTTNITSSLHNQCERLVQEREQLGKVASGMEARLNYFVDYDSLVDKVVTDTNAQDFTEQLNKLEQSILFLSSNLEYLESKVYLAKYKQIQARALANVRDAIVTKFKTATLKQQQQNNHDKTKIDLNIKSLYIEYRQDVLPLKPLITQLQKNPHQIFLHDILDAYYTSRMQLIGPIANTTIGSLQQKAVLSDFIRDSCAFLEQVCTQEESIFDSIFSGQNKEALTSLQTTFCEMMHEGLRSLVVTQSHIDELCDLVSILKNEVLIRKKMHEPIVLHMIQDIQERLIYISSVFLRDHIRLFKPIVIPSNQNYPTLDTTIALLTKLYPTVDLGVFDNLAQEAIAMCVDTFIEAGNKILQEKRNVMDAELFLIKHFLLLTKQIGAFKISFTKTETKLDFSHLREGISRFLSGQASIRSSIIFDIMSQATPRIVSVVADTRRNLETLLRTYCDALVLNTTKAALEPIMNIMRRDVVSQVEQSNAFEHFKKDFPNVMQNLKLKLPEYLDDATVKKLYEAICGEMNQVYADFYNKVNVDVWSIEEFKNYLSAPESAVVVVDGGGEGVLKESSGVVVVEENKKNIEIKTDGLSLQVVSARTPPSPADDLTPIITTKVRADW